MKPLWFPMSALLDGEIDCWASPAMLRMPLAAGQPARVRYVGDQMWPAFHHGADVEVSPLPDRIAPGAVVVARCEGNLELWRVVRTGEGKLWVVGDAGTEAPREIDAGAALGVVACPSRVPGRFLRGWRRARLDLREARRGLSEARAESVRLKYDQQSAAYASQENVEPSREWTESVRGHFGDSGRVLVIGSGTGQECRALARLGFACEGIDFSPRMIEQAEKLLAGSGLEDKIDFRVADVRELEPAAGEFDGVLFTPDVYSFLPRRADRIAILERLRRALPERGRILLDARVVGGWWARVALAAEWMAAGRGTEPGDSHTRFLSPDGTIHRSFVHCFAERSLRGEIARAGLRVVAVERGFHVLAPNANRGLPA